MPNNEIASDTIETLPAIYETASLRMKSKPAEKCDLTNNEIMPETLKHKSKINTCQILNPHLQNIEQ